MVSAAGARGVFPVCERALAAGATLLEAVWDMPYGDRRGMVKDRWGNVWQVATRPTKIAVEADIGSD